MRLADLCTLRLGGPARDYLRSGDRDELAAAVARADAAGEPVLFLGGGSNLVAPDGEFPGLVAQDARTDVTVYSPSEVEGLTAGTVSVADFNSPEVANPGETVFLRVAGGLSWDEFVGSCVDQGLSGLEALSGIPGVVGAAPVQNIGAYGGEVADCLVGVRAWDRQTGKNVYLTKDALRLGYRDSILKQSRLEPAAFDWALPEEGSVGGNRGAEPNQEAVDRTIETEVNPGKMTPTGQWIVWDVDFALRRGGGTPVRYAQLARALDVELGTVMPAARVREAVLELRRSKGMVLDPADHDTWSVGSFFTNPILPAEAVAALELPESAPRWEAMVPNSAGETGVKLSAAWLIEHSGIPKGFALPGSGAGVSTKHVLSLTNRGHATAADIEALAGHIITAVEGVFGITLVPEPVIL